MASDEKPGKKSKPYTPYHVQKSINNKKASAMKAEALKKAAKQLGKAGGKYFAGVTCADALYMYGLTEAGGLKTSKTLSWPKTYKPLPWWKDPAMSKSDAEAEYAGCCLPVAGRKDETEPV